MLDKTFRRESNIDRYERYILKNINSDEANFPCICNNVNTRRRDHLELLLDNQLKKRMSSRTYIISRLLVFGFIFEIVLMVKLRILVTVLMEQLLF